MIDMSLQAIAAAMGGEVSGNQVLCPALGHSPKDRSLAIRLDDTAPGGFMVHCFAPGDDPLANKDHVREVLGIDWRDHAPNRQQKPAVSIARMTNRVSPPEAVAPSGHRRVVASYIYTLPDGTNHLRVLRYEPKSFSQQRWDGKDWVKGGVSEHVPYNLAGMLKAVHSTVYICEGEKDADALIKAGFVATTNAMGAGKWPSELNKHFAGKTVFILPHNDPDEKGLKHARLVASSLAGVTLETRIVELPNRPANGGDVVDWLDAGGDPASLADFCKAAPIYTDVEVMDPPKALIVHSSDFLRGFIPPDYLIDGLIQRRFCYSFTAPTGSGKTAIALLMVACVALGVPFGDYPVEQGRALYLAGENPDDIRMRWTAMAESMGFDANTIDVNFLPGVFKLSEISPRIHEEVEKIGAVSLVVVDTSAAYFEGDEENANVQMGHHARRMRGLVDLPGQPTVLIACHPVKNAGQDNLLPRGGGAFIAEVDGNLTCWKSDNIVNLHWQGKFRGPDFAPVSFGLSTVTPDALRDSKGRPIPTVVAKALSERERSEAESSSRSDEDLLLLAIAGNERASMAGLADILKWSTKDGKPNKSKVQRAAERLKRSGLVKVERGGLTLTDKGKKEATRVQTNADLAGARCG